MAWLSPVALLPSILGRLLRAVAANSKFTLAAVADMYAVCEAISAYAKDAAQLETVGFAIDASPGRLELTAGPFVQPAFHASDASGALWGALEDAVDAVDSVFGAGYELLRIRCSITIVIARQAADQRSKSAHPAAVSPSVAVSCQAHHDYRDVIATDARAEGRQLCSEAIEGRRGRAARLSGQQPAKPLGAEALA